MPSPDPVSSQGIVPDASLPAPERASGLDCLCFAAPTQPEPTGYDRHIDGLRGFAAVSVMAVHGLGWLGEEVQSPVLDVVRNFHLSHTAVLLFFITSGYVIGLTNQKPFSWARAREYLRRRELRLMPIYLLAVVAGVLVAPLNDRWVIAANLFFLQNSAWNISVVAGNLPVWSLHYEAVYYLVFLWIWAGRPPVVPVAAAIVALAGFDWFFGTPLSFLGGWSAGAAFWLAGLWLAWHREAAPPTPFLALILLAFATNHFWPGVVFLQGFGFPYAGKAALGLADLSFLPMSVVLFCAVANLRFPGLRLLRWAAIAIPVGVCVILLAMGRLWTGMPWKMSAVAVAIALPLLAFDQPAWGAALIGAFRPLGRISYALYLFHVPCLLLVRRVFPWSGSVASYAGSVACWFALTLVLSWLAEAVMQPALMSHYRKARARLT